MTDNWSVRNITAAVEIDDEISGHKYCWQACAQAAVVSYTEECAIAVTAEFPDGSRTVEFVYFMGARVFNAAED